MPYDKSVEVNILDQTKLKKYWYASLYDKHVTETDDVQFIIRSIGPVHKKVLEVACGSGRILYPLTKAGHTIIGLDLDEFMLERCKTKTLGSSNTQLRLENGVCDDWGSDFDVVILAANILLNIESQIDYVESQKIFLRKAYNSLRLDGDLILIFDNSNIWPSFVKKSEKVIFEGEDDTGVFGRYIHRSNIFDSASRIMETQQRVELMTKDGEELRFDHATKKYFPISDEVVEWLFQIGFRNMKIYGDYSNSVFSNESTRVIIIAQK